MGESSQGVRRCSIGYNALDRLSVAAFVRRRRLALALRTSRRALLTAVAVGNSAATSGASRIRFVPSAKRLAYFPRVPPLKSYSGLSCSRDWRATRFLLAFFIDRPFPTGGGSSANDSNDVATLEVSDDYDVYLVRLSNQDKAFFVLGMVGIRNGY